MSQTTILNGNEYFTLIQIGVGFICVTVIYLLVLIFFPIDLRDSITWNPEPRKSQRSKQYATAAFVFYCVVILVGFSGLGIYLVLSFGSTSKVGLAFFHLASF